MGIFEAAIGLLAPPNCLGCDLEGAALCEACIASEIMPYGERCWRCGALSRACRTCQHCRWFGGPRYCWIVTDYAGLAAKLVRGYKFQQIRYLDDALAGLMAEAFLSFHADELITKRNYLLVSLPTATRRVRRRGFDHIQRLGKNLATKVGLEFVPALVRHGQSSQVGAFREARLKQLIGQFVVRWPEVVVGRNILVIDDVVTTGGTLRAATKALRAAGAKHVDALVFAKRL